MKDTGLNAEVEYAFKPSPDSASFAVDAATGWISLNQDIENR